MIPQYVFNIAERLSLTDDVVEQAYLEMQSLKFILLERQTHKEFFLAVISLFGVGVAIRICEWIMNRYKPPRTEVPRYKHEICLHWLNCIDSNKADKVLMMALINLEDDILKIRKAIDFLRINNKATIKRCKIINFI